MGACMNKESGAKYRQPTESQVSDSKQQLTNSKRVPTDFGLSTIPSSFNLFLGNIKIKILEQVQTKIIGQRQCKVRFQFGQFAKYESQMNIDANGKHVFNPEFQTHIEISEEEISRTSVDITIQDNVGEVGDVSINLFDVATGPYHFDYDFPLKGKNKGATRGKISFDLKMSQIIVLQLRSTEILCNMNENLVKHAYKYSMKLVTHTHTFFSEYSEPFVNPAFTQEERKFDGEDSEEGYQQPRASIKKISTAGRQSFGKSLSKKKTVFFNDHQSGVNFKQLKWEGEQQQIVMDVEVPINQVAAASLQLCVWSYNPLWQDEDFSPQMNRKVSQLHRGKTTVAHNTSFDHHNHQNDGDMVMLCETYISLNQIFKHELDDAFELIDGVKMFTYNCHVDKGLWNHGQQEGSVSCNLVISLPAYLSQPIVGVRTNKCVQQSSSVINDSQQIQVKEISELANCLAKMNESVFKLQSKGKQTSGPERLVFRQTLNTSIHNTIELLKKSHKESMMSFYYKSQGDLFKAQDVMLQIAHHAINTADELDDSTRERYYQILQLIMSRGELALSQMGFTAKTESTIQKLISTKLSVGLSYQKFLYTALQMVLHKLQQKAYSDNERQFIETFCAQAFFQIPEFRTRFCECLLRADDPPLVEWRGTEFKLDETQEQGEYFNKDIRDLFDWESHFYVYLDKQCMLYVSMYVKRRVLAETEWKKRFGKRGVAFFRFLSEWCNHVDKNVVVKEHIPWQDIPGYRSLLRAFLLEVKLKKLMDFPDSLKQTIFAVLSNQSLLNVFIVLLFNKTQLYDSESLKEMLEILNEALQNIGKGNRKLPTQVDIPFFIRGIRTILNDCEHAFCLSKCIWLLYNSYTMFSIEVRKELNDIIFPNLAIRFFMHWSQNVRMIFHHYLIFRVLHLHHTNRYAEFDHGHLMKQLEQARRPKRHNSVIEPNINQIQLVSDLIYMKYMRLQHFLEEARTYCKEKHDAELMEERTYAKAMRQKLLLRQMEERRKRLNNNQPQPQEMPQGFRIEVTTLKPPALHPSKSEYEPPSPTLHVSTSVPQRTLMNG